MESNEGKWVADVKTVCKLIESVPASSTRVPWLWKQQNCPSVSVTKLVSPLLVPVTPGALGVGALLKESRPALCSLVLTPDLRCFFREQGAFYVLSNSACWFFVLHRGLLPSLLPHAIPVTSPLSLSSSCPFPWGLYFPWRATPGAKSHLHSLTQQIFPYPGLGTGGKHRRRQTSMGPAS